MNSAQMALELRARRMKAGLTQAAMARAMGTSQPAVARAEAGLRMPSTNLINRWAAATGYPITLAFGLAEKPLTSREKARLVRTVLGRKAFDPWARLADKEARGLNVELERRYLATVASGGRAAPVG